jgi:hypothetical protein
LRWYSLNEQQRVVAVNATVLPKVSCTAFVVPSNVVAFVAEPVAIGVVFDVEIFVVPTTDAAETVAWKTIVGSSSAGYRHLRQLLHKM